MLNEVLAWSRSSWKVAKVPSLSGGPFARNELLSVTCVTARDCWAVGFTGYPQSVALHWNGAAWTVVPTPHPKGGSSLSSVACASSTDCWAIGTPILHWNGTTWKPFING
jgi:hypothetical protein